MQLSKHGAAFAFDCTLTPPQPLLLQGKNGYSRKGREPRQWNCYLSWPQLKAIGQPVLDGRWRRTDGRAWFDHE